MGCLHLDINLAANLRASRKRKTASPRGQSLLSTFGLAYLFSPPLLHNSLHCAPLLSTRFHTNKTSTTAVLDCSLADTNESFLIFRGKRGGGIPLHVCLFYLRWRFVHIYWFAALKLLTPFSTASCSLFTQHLPRRWLNPKVEATGRTGSTWLATMAHLGNLF